jgi:putative DNA methylase
LWWARRPLAAARAVIFSQLVHDPEDLWRCQNPGKEPNAQVKGHWTKARERLFTIIEDLVKWENTTNAKVIEAASEEIRRSWRETCELNKDHPQKAELFDPSKMPGLHDPFAGGGAIPLEAQRLGIDAYASDLNPVAVLINKAMIEIPPMFAGMPPVNPDASNDRMLVKQEWRGSAGLAHDLGYYGLWMREEAQKRIGALYPPVEITKLMAQERPDLQPYVGKKLTVIAWLWARTVKSPNPAFSHVDVPLANTFILNSKPGKEAYVQPIIEKGSYRFTVKIGPPPSEAKAGTSAGKRQAFCCLMSSVPMSYEYIREQGKAGRMGQKLMAIVVKGTNGRIYLSPEPHAEAIAASAKPTWKPDCEMPKKHRNFQPPVYGMNNLGDLFTPRQLVTLTIFSDLVSESRAKIRTDAIAAGLPDDDKGVAEGGIGARAYAEAVSLYLAFSIDKASDYWSTICSWHSSKELIRNTFGRQAIPMTWDFAETNAFSDSAGNVSSGIEWAQKTILAFPTNAIGFATQGDAQTQSLSCNRFVSTDPPYFDNISYAELSDYFYVWLRRSMRDVFPGQLATMAVPKKEELIAAPHRHGSKHKAEEYFLDGMTKAMRNLAEKSHPAAPITIYYAFKQSETETDGTNSTGWETFLEAVNRAGLALTGTWPMRTELGNRMIGSGANALASSIILVCRPRPVEAETVSRRQFIRELNAALPIAMDAMTREGEGLYSPVAPVDLSQAIVGPGMAVFSKYAAVLEADGTPMTVRTALQLINRFLAEDDFDADTQFCLHWFEQYGWETGKFGEADTLARAKGTSVDGVRNSGVLHSAGGNVRLLKWAEYSSDWDPKSDDRLPIWEVLHQLIRVFNTDGESGAAAVFAAVQSKAEAARQLAYRLYTLCERKNWAEDARAYNEVVTSWSGIESAAAKEPTAIQPMLFDN